METVIERLQKRDGLSRAEIMNRIHSQMPLEEKIKRADYVINNDGSVEDLKSQINALLIWLKKKSVSIKSFRNGYKSNSLI